MARLVAIDAHVNVQYLIEVTGDNALANKDIEWPEKHFEPQSRTRLDPDGNELPPTLRLYAKGERTAAGVMFMLPPVKEFDFARMQFYRAKTARIAAFRPTDDNAKLSGFGRPNPVTGRSCHQDFSETYVDRAPGTAYTNYKKEPAVWTGFEPVWLKVKAGTAEPYYILVTTTWSDESVTVNTQQDPDEVPPEKLAEFGFPERVAAPMAKLSDFVGAAKKRHRK